jgi:hypothetical protein
LVPEPSSSEVETAIEELKWYKSPGTDQISAEIFQSRGEKLRSDSDKLINIILNVE